ncbi:MAG: hypothetical protein IKA21_01715 [Phascolarctobacterium sp.]|nr:hypothetical protein [Phascolarctobacterium sp.]
MKKIINIILSCVFLLSIFAVSGCAKLDDKNIVLKPVEWTRSAKILGLKLSSDNFGVLVTNNGDATVQVNFKADCYDKGDFWLEAIDNVTVPAIGAKQSVYVPMNPTKKETEKIKYSLIKQERSKFDVLVPGIDEDNKSGVIYNMDYAKEKVAIANSTKNKLNCFAQVVYYDEAGEIIYARSLFEVTVPAGEKVAAKFDMGRTPKAYAKMDVLAAAAYKK